MALPSSTSSSRGSHWVSHFSPQMQGRICNDEHRGGWQSYSLEIIKCWSLFKFFFSFQPYDFCWWETYKETGQHQKNAWGCCRWPGPSGSQNQPNKQAVALQKVHSISISWATLILIPTPAHQKCPQHPRSTLNPTICSSLCDLSTNKC